MNNQYDLDTIVDTITNYLIDDDIVISEKDTNYIKFKKYLLKYKHIIGILFLIVLSIIGYYCDPFHLYHPFHPYYKDDSKDLSTNQIQAGGGSLASQAKAEVKAAKEQAKSAAKEAAATVKADAKAAKVHAQSDAGRAEAIKAKGEAKAAASKAKADAKAAKPGTGDKLAASGQSKIDKHKQAAKDFKKKATSLKTYTGALSGAAGAAGDLVSNNADLIFQIFYSIAIFILICIVTVPAIAFVGIGILCYVLLKPKMEALKAL